MLWYDPSRVDGPRPVGGVSSFRPLDLLARVPSWLLIIVFCCVVPILLAMGGYLWLMRPLVGPTRHAPITARADDQWAARVAPKVFPPWIEVPYLDGPLRRENDARPPETDTRTDVPRSSVGPLIGTTAPIVSSPSRIDPQTPSFERVSPIDGHLQPRAGPAVQEMAERLTATEVSTLPPSDSAAIEPANIAQAWSPAPLIRPKPRAQPAVTVSRPTTPHTDPDQTASVTGLPRSVRPRVDAGAVARASVHRGQSPRGTGSPAATPVRSWTLPGALAPTQ